MWNVALPRPRPGLLVAAALAGVWLLAPVSGSAQQVRVSWQATVEVFGSPLPLEGTLGVLDGSLAEPQPIDAIVTATVDGVVFTLFPGETTAGSLFQFTDTDPAQLAGELVGDPVRLFNFIDNLSLTPPATANLGTGGPGGLCRFAPTCVLPMTFVFTPEPPDADLDWVPDADDNCVNVPNPDQKDADVGLDDDAGMPGVQHYGDACDGDLDNDGRVAAVDFFQGFRPCLGLDLETFPACRRADLDGDDVVGASDFFSVMLPSFGGLPGPGVTEAP